jgi:putative PIN family toxin of toxin-antitoxin system
MNYYAVIDTNVLVSALLKNGSVPSLVMAEALKGDITPVLNNEIIAEYEDVLSRPKFSFDKTAVRVLLEELKKRAIYSDYGIIFDEIPDPKDVVFYAVLMEKRKENDTYLITGNLKHFPMRTYIVTPREMLDIIEEGR